MYKVHPLVFSVTCVIENVAGMTNTISIFIETADPHEMVCKGRGCAPQHPIPREGTPLHLRTAQMPPFSNASKKQIQQD
jgi:hypothetical protein